MERGYVLAAALAACALAASAFGWGSFICSFDVPFGNRNPNGVAVTGYSLNFNTNNSHVDYRFTVLDSPINPGSLRRINISPTDFTTGLASGVIAGRSYHWVVSYSPRMIYRVGGNTGSIYNSFKAPGIFPYGATFRPTFLIPYLYYTDRVGKKLYRMNALTGSVYASYSLSFAPGDCAYDPAGFIYITEPTNRLVRRCTLTGSTIDYFSTHRYGRPTGCGYNSLFKRLWVGFSYPVPRLIAFTVYVERDSPSSVAPASLGKIKAVFE